MFSHRKSTNDLRSFATRVAEAGVVGVALCAGLPGLADTPKGEQQPSASPHGQKDASHEHALDKRELRELAKEAYVWGWPLVYMHQLRVSLERVPFPAVTGGVPVAPINQLSMLTDVIRPGAAAIPCANQDVIYGFGLFDLKDEGVVIQVPDFGERFWLYQLGDQRTDSFAQVGCMHNTEPGFYLIVGPNWDKPIPEGIKKENVLRSPTRHAYCLPRVHFENSEDDRQAALPAVNQIVAYPLSEFDGDMRSCDWSKPRWVPSRYGKPRSVAPDKFYEALSEVLEDVPPLPGEEELYARLGRMLAQASEDPQLSAELKEIAVETERDVVGSLFEFRNIGVELPGHWTTILHGGRFGTNYIERLAAAKSNIFVNLRKETVYLYQDFDADGELLHGSNSYELTFPADKLPPAEAFWSLTVYDEKHLLPNGVGGRVSIGSRDKDLVRGADGSLTILIGKPQVQEGDTEEKVNRLCPPPGKFSIYLRIYQPTQEALDGTWLPPGVKKITGVEKSGEE